MSLGYQAIGLAYNNQTAVGVRCLNDMRCFATVRRTEVDGTVPSSFLSLPPRDGTIKQPRGVIALASPPDANVSDVAARWVTGVPHRG